MIKAETHLEMIKAETHLGMIKAKTLAPALQVPPTPPLSHSCLLHLQPRGIWVCTRPRRTWV